MDNAKISAAFVSAQRAFGPALKTSTNPHFKSKYADLAACIEAVIDALNVNGIALLQRQHPNDSGVSVETIFVHESGEQLSAGILNVPSAKNDPQGYGSALTYARRYSLMAACGIAPEDDDGNAGARASAAAKAAAADRAELRKSWLAVQREAIMGAATVGALRTLVTSAVDAAMAENDSEAVDQINAWAEEKKAQAKKVTI